MSKMQEDEAARRLVAIRSWPGAQARLRRPGADAKLRRPLPMPGSSPPAVAPRPSSPPPATSFSKSPLSSNPSHPARSPTLSSLSSTTTH